MSNSHTFPGLCRATRAYTRTLRPSTRKDSSKMEVSTPRCKTLKSSCLVTEGGTFSAPCHQSSRQPLILTRMFPIPSVVFALEKVLQSGCFSRRSLVRSPRSTLRRRWMKAGIRSPQTQSSIPESLCEWSHIVGPPSRSVWLTSGELSVPQGTFPVQSRPQAPIVPSDIVDRRGLSSLAGCLRYLTRSYMVDGTWVIRKYTKRSKALWIHKLRRNLG